MADSPVRYRSADEDSARWQGFPFRADDIVISTRSKSGTTWMQMICALLVFQTPDLPAPLSTLSPWLDWLVVPEDAVIATLRAQEHRRFIKTHTPLDGVPRTPGVTYIVIGRHPLDSAVSLYYQSENLDRDRIAELTGTPATVGAPPPPVEEWLQSWITSEADPREELDSLPGILWHLRGAWDRRHDPSVVMVHYDELLRDLDGQMRQLAARLQIDIDEDRWPGLVEAATFQSMKRQADSVVPDPSGVIKSHEMFFRTGRSGSGEALLTPTQRSMYYSRAGRLAPADLLAWVHHDPA